MLRHLLYWWIFTFLAGFVGIGILHLIAAVFPPAGFTQRLLAYSTISIIAFSILTMTAGDIVIRDILAQQTRHLAASGKTWLVIILVLSLLYTMALVCLGTLIDFRIQAGQGTYPLFPAPDLSVWGHLEAWTLICVCLICGIVQAWLAAEN